MRRVVITGMGMVSPLGNDIETSWNNAKNGVSGIGPITRVKTDNIPVKVAGEVKDFDVSRYMDKKDARRMDRFSQYAVAAAVQAMEDAGFDENNRPESGRFGVIVGSGVGGIETLEANCIKLHEKGHMRVNPLLAPMMIANIAAGNIAMRFQLEGHCSCVVTACAAGANSIGDAFRLIKHGYADAMLSGAGEADIGDIGIAAFMGLQALSTEENPENASIPFDARRTGFVMGEGAGILCLEEYEHAKARGANIYAEIKGYGATSDAYHLTAPHPEGKGAANAMRLALQEGGVSPEQIAYINAHGTSTVYNDKMETLAVKTVFGEHAYKLAISSTKSMTGHLLGASGAIEAIFTVMGMRHSYILPTINYKEKDPNCDLDVVPNVGREAEIAYALSNSFGFGGQNASLLFARV
ncbi:beta-ketoacyl-ACP synthase II [Clostridia bacterium OttesenSCG-928-F22]|nr:beta-ketoacyl-ACP synthase II [Clostridia bacterium OttesenSCG-928-F22]